MNWRSDITTIITKGTWAPSGDNSQPWRFVVGADVVDIYNLPDRDNPYYNFRQNGSLASHGAVIENMTIAARELGYSVSVELFPDSGQPDLVSRLRFEASQPQSQLLFDSIEKRGTNRKAYKKILLTDAERQTLVGSLPEGVAGRLFLIEDRAAMKKLGRAVSTNEIVALENRTVHDIFFGELVWNEREVQERKAGLYIKTMELPPPIQLIFPLLKRWPIQSFLNKLGFAKFAAFGNSQQFSTGAAFIAVVVPHSEAKDFIATGRIMQRAWLTATSLGLRVHPISGVLFLMQRIFADQANELSAVHIKLLKDAYNSITQACGVAEGMVTMLLRVGHGPEPSARSPRRPPNMSFT